MASSVSNKDAAVAHTFVLVHRRRSELGEALGVGEIADDAQSRAAQPFVLAVGGFEREVARLVAAERLDGAERGLRHATVGVGEEREERRHDRGIGAARERVGRQGPHGRVLVGQAVEQRVARRGAPCDGRNQEPAPRGRALAQSLEQRRLGDARELLQ